MEGNGRRHSQEKDPDEEVKYPLINGKAKEQLSVNNTGLREGEHEDKWRGTETLNNRNNARLSAERMVAGEVLASERIIKHPTSYFETLVHTLKGNVGSGMFAMGEAFKHAGLAVGSVLTLILGVICIYNNHVLINCAEYVQEKKHFKGTSFESTVEHCFLNGPKQFQKWTTCVRRLVKTFVITTQLGFCCVYIVLVSSTLKEIVRQNWNVNLDNRIYMLMIFIPILASSLITSLKFLAPISLGSNICVMGAVFLTLYVTCRDGLPDPSTRSLTGHIEDLPLFVGTVIYAFEGIGLILPLQNEMKKPRQFGSTFGVLNVGLTIVMAMLVSVGFLGYLKFGDEVKSSLSLNINPNEAIGIVVQCIFAIGIGFSYPLQFYVAADIVWDDVNDKWGPYDRELLGKLLTRTGLVICTFIISAIIPNIGAFISLIGAVCSTALALVFPALSDIAIRTSSDDPLKTKDHNIRLLFDGVTLIVAVIGFTTGAYCSVKEIIEVFIHGNQTS